MTLPELLQNIETSTMLEIINSSDEEIVELLNDATRLFDSYGYASQMTVMALMMGMILATIEGEPCQGEGELGVIITHKERTDIFLTQMRTIFRQGMESRQQHDSPDMQKSAPFKRGVH